MATPLKDLFSKQFYTDISNIFSEVYPEFQKEKFITSILIPSFEKLEMKERMRVTTMALSEVLPSNIEDADRFLTAAAKIILKDQKYKYDLPLLIFPDYYEVYGIEFPHISIPSLAVVTRLVSSEFAIRPFIELYPDIAFEYFAQWIKSDDEHIRRLASEGTRSKLPWGRKVQYISDNPERVLNLIKSLQDDESEYVRRSVANNLNDISKDHPEKILKICEKWIGHSNDKNRLVKHALRTLLKSGNNTALSFFEYSKAEDIEVLSFEITNRNATSTMPVIFDFTLKNKAYTASKIRIEYFVYLLKKNGTHSKKIFKISERTVEGNIEINFSKSHSFRPVTTRDYQSGVHFISIVINGVETNKIEFQLTVN